MRKDELGKHMLTLKHAAYIQYVHHKMKTDDKHALFTGGWKLPGYADLDSQGGFRVWKMHYAALPLHAQYRVFRYTQPTTNGFARRMEFLGIKSKLQRS
jgi:hypothetical protein